MENSGAGLGPKRPDGGLDGTGGDEIFSGYYRDYRTSHFLSLLYSGKFVDALTAYRAAQGSISVRTQCAQRLKSALMNTNVWVRSVVRELYVNRLLEQEFSFHAGEANRSIASGYCHVENDRFGSAGMNGLRSIQLAIFRREFYLCGCGLGIKTPCSRRLN